MSIVISADEILVGDTIRTTASRFFGPTSTKYILEGPVIETAATTIHLDGYGPTLQAHGAGTVVELLHRPEPPKRVAKVRDKVTRDHVEPPVGSKILLAWGDGPTPRWRIRERQASGWSVVASYNPDYLGYPVGWDALTEGYILIHLPSE